MFLEDQDHLTHENQELDEGLETVIEGAFDDDEDMEDVEIITMIDEETDESFSFMVAYDFTLDDDLYHVLISMDDEEPIALFARKIELEDGSLGYETVDEDEFPRVFAEYERLCEEMDEEEDEDYELNYLDEDDEHDHDHDHHHDCGCGCHHD